MSSIQRFILVALFLLIGGELITRMFITSPADSMPDQEIGWIYKPHARIFYTEEGWAVNEINSMGFNDRELVVSKDKHEVLVLGDSFTEALQVPQSKNFTSLAEEANPCIDVINAGRSGLSPVQYDVLSERFFKAALIGQVVIVLNASDMKDMMNSDAEIVRDSNGAISDIKLNERKLSWLRQAMDVVFSNSALAHYLKNRVRAGLHGRRRAERNSIQRDEKETVSRLKEVMSFIFLKIEEKAPLAVIYIPDLEFLPHGEVVHNPESIRFERIIAEVTGLHGIHYHSALEYMVQGYKTDFNPPVGFSNSNVLGGHLNELGHKCVHSALMRILEKECHHSPKISTVIK